VEAFFDAVQEMLSGLAVNFEVVLLNSTTVAVPAGVAASQVSVAIEGQYRWITVQITRAHPGGAAGVYDLYVTAAANDPVSGAPAGNDFSFALAIVPTNTLPAGVAIARKMRRLQWSGTEITRIDRLDIEPPLRPPLVTALPLLQPVGTEIDLQTAAMASAGAGPWRYRRNAGGWSVVSAGAAWASHRDSQDVLVGPAAGAWTGFGSDPSVVAPIDGHYRVHSVAQFRNNLGALGVEMGVRVGAVDPSGLNGTAMGQIPAADQWCSLSHVRTLLSVPAGTTLSQRVRFAGATGVVTRIGAALIVSPLQA